MVVCRVRRWAVTALITVHPSLGRVCRQRGHSNGDQSASNAIYFSEIKYKGQIFESLHSVSYSKWHDEIVLYSEM